MGPYYLDGNWGYNQYDIKNAKFILSFGADPIASNRQVSFYSQTWGDSLDQATVVDPRLSASAAKAHKWIPIEPGQDSVLALAIAHVALVEGVWHKPFLLRVKTCLKRVKPSVSRALKKPIPTV